VAIVIPEECAKCSYDAIERLEKCKDCTIRFDKIKRQIDIASLVKEKIFATCFVCGEKIERFPYEVRNKATLRFYHRKCLNSIYKKNKKPSKRTNLYTKEEDDFIKQNYLGMTDEELSCFLKRTEKSIYRRREDLKLKKYIRDKKSDSI